MFRPRLPVYMAGQLRVGVTKVDDKVSTYTNQNGEAYTFTGREEAIISIKVAIPKTQRFL